MSQYHIALAIKSLPELDYSDEKSTKLRKEILSSFKKSCHKNGYNIDSVEVQGVGCQTEVLASMKDGSSRDSEDSSDVKRLEASKETDTSQETVTDDGAITEEVDQVTKSIPNKQGKKKIHPRKNNNSDLAVPKEPHESQAPEKPSADSKPNNAEPKTKDARRKRRYVHPCLLCGRLFRRPCEVKQHLLSHGGAKPYQCQECGKRFGSKSGAGIHALKQHGKDISAENIINVCHDPMDTLEVTMVDGDEEVKNDTANNNSDNFSGSEDDDDDFEWKMDDTEFGFNEGKDVKLEVSDGDCEKGGTEHHIDDDDDEDDDDDDEDNDEDENDDGDEDTKDSKDEGEINEDKKISLESVVVKKELEFEERDLKETLKVPRVKNEQNSHNLSGSSLQIGPQILQGLSKNELKNARRRERRRRQKNDSFPKPPKHKCEICGKMWRTTSEYKSHIATHSDERPFICEICGQAYKHKTALDVHVGMHNGINPFSCPYCNKAFTQKGALQRHLPIHTGEAPYQCELCGKRFVHHTSFNMHTLAHTGQKSYKCAVCGLALLSGSHLKRHSRVHTGERPYQCQTCGKRFAERYNLVAHTRVHDPLAGGGRESAKKMHRCQLCGASFDRKPKLEDHMALSHNKINDADDSRKWLGFGHLFNAADVNHHHHHQGMSGVQGNSPPQQSAAAPPSQRLPPPPVHTPPDHDINSSSSAHSHHQQGWHHMLFGNKLESDMMDGSDKLMLESQHRLLSEMSVLGGMGPAHGRNMLASGLHHSSQALHIPGAPNPHALLQSRVNMFSPDN
uniref:C2H2-type domain-containing protein n=1 Tax=Timema tahoe TaxID=61484 RepID=A0A7R9IK86_9NEOP|nr:unnamed protein product [Timema tahoe]